MNVWNPWIVAAGVVAALSAMIWRLDAARLRGRGRLRLEASEADGASSVEAPQAFGASTGDDYSLGRIEAWLFRSGFPRRGAAARFLASCVVAAVAGAVLAWGLVRSGLVAQLAALAGAVPGGVSDLLAPLAWGAPWFLGAEVAALPWIVVHLARQRRVREVEQDLPLLLDLLAALSEAGMSFDAAVDRVAPSLPKGRALAPELSVYQMELLAGRRRSAALRRLAWRLDVPSVSIFVSALIHADQVGAGMAAVLRRQADDLRQRRREQALAHALAVQVKMIVPMITCFLPSIFVISLGPIFLRFFEMADSMFGKYAR